MNQKISSRLPYKKAAGLVIAAFAALAVVHQVSAQSTNNNNSIAGVMAAIDFLLSDDTPSSSNGSGGNGASGGNGGSGTGQSGGGQQGATSPAPVPIAISDAQVPALANPVAGSLQGNLSVGKDGAASYAIPVPVPPGTGGMVPHLSIAYSGSNTTGSAGLGWSLGGLSNIDRCGKTFAVDGIPDAVRYDHKVWNQSAMNYVSIPEDKLCLDGKRLILVNGDKTSDTAYWSDNAEYRLETDNSTRVTTLIKNGRRSFVVAYKGGITQSFGDTEDSYVNAGRTDGQTYRWRLSRQSDVSGNYISYIYQQDGATGENKPKEIRYGGNLNSGQAHFAKVSFTYESRPDARTAYVSGSHADERLRLRAINGFTDIAADGSGGTATQVLNLSYEQSPSSGRSLLSSIQLCDGSQRCLPATVFNWGKPSANAQKQFVPLGSERTGPNLNAIYQGVNATASIFGQDVRTAKDQIIIADFNGDGKADILERYRVAGNNFQQNLFLSNSDGSGWTVVNPFSGIAGNVGVIATGDFIGDGSVQLLVADTVTDNKLSANMNWRVCRNDITTKGAFTCDKPVSLPADAFGSYDVSGAMFARDFNGAGKDSLFLDFNLSTNEPGIVVLPRYKCDFDGTNFNCAKSWIGEVDRDNDPNRVSYANADVDGDGFADSIKLNRCKFVIDKLASPVKNYWDCGDGSAVSYQSTRRLVNSHYGSDGQWLEFPEGPTAEKKPLPNTASITFAPSGGTLTYDVNADGYTDLLFGLGKVDRTQAISQLTTMYCMSKGDGHADCKVLPKGNVAGSSDTVQEHAILTVADFNQDGLPEILRPSNDIWTDDYARGFHLCKVNAEGGRQDCEQWSAPTVRLGRLRNPQSDRNNAEDFATFLYDFNGDGTPDLLVYMGGSYNGGNKWQVYTAASQANPGEVLDKLISVTNGIGHTERVEYTSAGDLSVYPADTAATSYPVKATRYTRPLIKTLYRSNGQGGTTSTSFRYHNYAVDATGRGSAGFAQIDQTDNQTNIVITESYLQSFPYTGSTASTQMRAPNGVVLVNATNTYSSATVTQSNGVQTILPYMATSLTVQNDWNGEDLGVTFKSQNAPDNWGNTTLAVSGVTSQAALASISGLPPAAMNREIQNRLTHKSTITSVYDNDPATWRLGEVRSVVETRVAPGSTVTRAKALSYDNLGRLQTEITQPDDAQLRLKKTYVRDNNPFGLVNKEILEWTDPASGTAQSRVLVSRQYTPEGRFIQQQTNAAGHQASFQYDARTGAAIVKTDANNLVSTGKSDVLMADLSETTPDGNEKRVLARQCGADCPNGATHVLIEEHYQGSNRIAVPVLTYKDSAGHVVRKQTFGFDGRKIVSDTRYDSRGREAESDWPRYEADVAVLAKRLEYDDLNRVIAMSVLDEQGNLARSETRYAGTERTLTNAKQQTRRESRDLTDHLTRIVDEKNGVTQYQYDAFGNLMQTTDPNGNLIVVQYDALGRRTDLKDPDLGWIHYDVDPLGQVWRTVSPNLRARNQAITVQFDAIGRMVARNEPDLSSRWDYDQSPGGANCVATRSCGKLVESYTLTAGGSKNYRQTYSYDNIGRPDTTVSYLDKQYTLKTEYDAWSRPIRQTRQRGSDTAKVFDNRYNAYGDLYRIERGNLLLWQATTMDAADRITTALLGNGLSINRDYNPRTGHLRQAAVQNAQGQAMLQEAYSYDVLGNVDRRSQFWPGTGFSEGFTYDGLNRLETSTVDGQAVQQFGYDGIGNLLRKTGAGTGDYNYGPQGPGAVRPHAVKSIPGLGDFRYDDNGNLISGAGRTLSWTSFDMPDTITKGSVSSSFLYGPEHQRIRQTRSDGTTIYYANGQEVEVQGNNVTVKTYWPANLGVEIDRAAGGTELNWTHTDRLGSVIAITNETGALREQMAYDSWGKRRTLNGAPVNGTPTPDNLDGVTDNKGFTGHEMLDQLDLVHMNGRIYDPLVARMMSADPYIQDPLSSQSYNRYTYVWNNPTNLTDPTGFSAMADSTSQYADKDGNCDKRCQQLEDDLEREKRKNPSGGKVQSNSRSADNTGGAGAANSVSPGSNYVPGLAPSFTVGNGCPIGMQCVVVSGRDYKITDRQRELLDSKDFLGFWWSRYVDSHDPVARTALVGWRSPKFASKATMFEKVASGYTWWNLEHSLEKSNALQANTMQNIGLDLAKAHAAAVDNDLRNQIGVPGLLSPQQVAEYHWDVFKKYGVAREVFGGTMWGLPANSYAITWCEGCDGNKK